MSEQLLKRLNNAGHDLKALRQPYETHFRELGLNFNPRRTRFDKAKDHRSDETINRKIINGRPSMALRTLQSGMHMGITSPSRPWFKMIPDDPGLRDYGPVKMHLASAERKMRQILTKSGLYSVLHVLWGDLGLYGTDAAIIEDDYQTDLFGQALVPGEYWLAANARGYVDTAYREYRMTVKQVVAKFVYRNARSNDPDWSVVSGTVKRMWDNGALSEKVPVRHLITPREERDPKSPLPRDKPIMSTYWEEGESEKVLGDLGYDINPILASRWDVEGTDTYGSSPAMDVLGDAKELQRKARDLSEAVRRMNRPPMNAPIEMRNNPFSTMPEAVNYMSDPSKGLVPTYQFTPPIRDLREDLANTEDALSEGMYSNLFFAISQLDRREITAREIDERSEERLIGLGPVLERQHREKLAMILRRVYAKALESGQVEPLPPELANTPVSIDYTSTLGQALKAVATGGMERLYGFTGNLAAVDTSVLDMVDNDAAITEYADMVGVPASIVRSKDEAEKIRAERTAQMQQQQAVEQANQMAQAANQGAQAASTLAEAGQPRGQRDILGELGLR